MQYIYICIFQKTKQIWTSQVTMSLRNTAPKWSDQTYRLPVNLHQTLIGGTLKERNCCKSWLRSLPGNPPEVAGMKFFECSRNASWKFSVSIFSGEKSYLVFFWCNRGHDSHGIQTWHVIVLSHDTWRSTVVLFVTFLILDSAFLFLSSPMDLSTSNPNQVGGKRPKHTVKAERYCISNLSLPPSTKDSTKLGHHCIL